MPRFRQARSPAQPRSPTPALVFETIRDVIDPRNFYAAPSLELEWVHLPEEVLPWEIYRGRLLEPAHCFQECRFSSWNIYQRIDGVRASEPLLAVRWDAEAGEIFVARGILAHVWEGYDAGANVILSRETTRWVRELVAAIPLEQFNDIEDLRDEIAGQLFCAVVGTSRLPITSLEAPLPAFTLGQLGYFLNASSVPAAGLADRLSSELSWRELAKLLEVVLRSDADPAGFVARWQQIGRNIEEIPALMRTMFNEVSLSPYTHFVDRALAFLHDLAASGQLQPSEEIDFLSFILRQLGRHLTAYDLVSFHYRGANYPDALLLDAALRRYLALIEEQTALFADNDDQARLRRRALRQACLLRRRYHGHLVPDVPTSPGENARVLPEPHVRVAEEQIMQPARRTRQLFIEQPLEDLLTDSGKRVLRQSIADLAHPAELRELGTAVFIERPLGVSKLPGEPDRTPLLAHEAFSRALARRRIDELRDLSGILDPDLQPWQPLIDKLTQMEVAGLPVDETWTPERPVVSLADAKRVAGDFLLVRTMPGSIREFAALFDLQQFAGFMRSGKGLIVWLPRGQAAVLAVFDERLRRRLDLDVITDAGFQSRGGVEYPAGGLRVLRAWREQDGIVQQQNLPIVPAVAD